MTDALEYRDERAASPHPLSPVTLAAAIADLRSLPPMTQLLVVAGAGHVVRMLTWAPQAVVLLRSADLHSLGRWGRLWSGCDIARIAYLVHRPIFGGDGGKTDFVCVDVRRKYAGPQSIEHWPERWG